MEFTQVLSSLGYSIITLDGNWYCQWSKGDKLVGDCFANNEDFDVLAEVEAKEILASLAEDTMRRVSTLLYH